MKAALSNSKALKRAYHGYGFLLLGLLFIHLFSWNVEAAIEKVISVSAGDGHTAVIKADGTLWMCGDNYYGQLGIPGEQSIDIPTKVMDGVKSVSAGEGHTAILKNDGSLWMCGYNEYGQLGDGSGTNADRPFKLMEGVKAVSAGRYRTAILKNDGTLWTCGMNEPHGYLGDGTLENRSTPVHVLSDVSFVSAGWNNIAAIKTDGSLWIWGTNEYYELGVVDGIDEEDSSGSYSSIPIKVMTGVKFVSVGAQHVAAIKNDNSLWMWGYNSYGELGDGTTSIRATPIKIMDNVKNVSAGNASTAIVKTDGSLWVCGSNFAGNLGDGTGSHSYYDESFVDTLVTTPKKVISSGVVDVDKGWDTTAILKTDGSLWVCGANNYFQLGPRTYYRIDESTCSSASCILTPMLFFRTEDDSTEGEGIEDTPDVQKGNTFIDARMLYSVDAKKGETVIKKAAATITKAVIPATIKHDGVEYKVTGIAAGAFQNSKVKIVSIGANVRTIGKNAFKGCTRLKKVTGGEGIKQIGASAFAGCTSLTKITIPAKVKKIGASAFLGDKKLIKITLKTMLLKKGTVGKNAFKGTSKKLVIKVPAKAKRAYKKFLKSKGNKKVRIK